MPFTSRFTITGGDSKFDLFQHLMLIGMTDANNNHVLKLFGVKGHFGSHVTKDNGIQEVLLEVKGIEAKDLSGESWIISGRDPGWSVVTRSFSRGQMPFTGLYDTRRRKGHLDFVFY